MNEISSGTQGEEVVRNVKIANTSTMMGVFKVRTNRRKRYVVSPSVAFLKPGESKDVRITFRTKEIDSVKAEISGTSGDESKRKKDTFLVQWMNVKPSFYFNDAFFAKISMSAWIEKASLLIKKVEKECESSRDRKKYFVYEKIHVSFDIE